MPMWTHELRATTHIAARPEVVWDILTDFERYPEWNTFIPVFRGEPRQGEAVKVRIHPPGGRAMTFRPRLLVVDPPRELRWRGKLLVRGLFDGEHTFLIQDQGDDGVTFEQSERFSGLLVPLLRKILDRHTQAGFEAMNAALKLLAEDARSES